MEICKGYGECMNPNTFKKYKNYICEKECEPLKCPNYEICGHYDTEYILDCHSGLCLNCDIEYGKWKGGKGELIFKDNYECPICLEIKRCVSYPKCEHCICIKCFKVCWSYDIEINIQEPEFPYKNNKEIEKEFWEISWEDENFKYKNDEKIQKFIKEFDKYNEIKEEIKSKDWNDKENLRKCPICRK